MKKQLIPLFFLFSLMLISLISNAYSVPSWVKIKSTIIADFKTYSGNNYTSIGHSVLGEDILAFYFGSGQTIILIDGAIHGHEYFTTQTLYYFAQWLITADANATAIRTRCTVVIIPILNIDEYRTEHRKNYNEVDLNRNFVKGWGSGSSNPTSEYYMGTSSASEPETQALRAFANTLKPDFYFTLHDFGGSESTNGDMRYPSYMGTTYNSICTTLNSKFISICTETDISKWGISSGGAYGGSRDDLAYYYGAKAFLIEQEYSGFGTPTETNITTLQTPRLENLIIAVEMLYGNTTSETLPEINNQFITAIASFAIVFTCLGLITRRKRQ